MLNKRFTFLCSDDERQMLKSLSEHLHRSQGDTVRFLIRETVTELEQEPDKSEQSLPTLRRLQIEK